MEEACPDDGTLLDCRLGRQLFRQAQQAGHASIIDTGDGSRQHGLRILGQGGVSLQAGPGFSRLCVWQRHTCHYDFTLAFWLKLLGGDNYGEQMHCILVISDDISRVHVAAKKGQSEIVLLQVIYKVNKTAYEMHYPAKTNEWTHYKTVIYHSKSNNV